MCFSSATPQVTPAKPMPTERDGNLVGIQKRQQAAAGASDTNKTGGLGVTEEAKTYKPTLGA